MFVRRFAESREETREGKGRKGKERKEHDSIEFDRFGFFGYIISRLVSRDGVAFRRKDREKRIFGRCYPSSSFDETGE